MRKKYALQCPKCKKTGLLRLTSGRGGRLSVRCSNCRAILRCLIDRRPHPRRSPIPAVTVVTSSEEQRNFSGELADISATGCRVRAKGLAPELGQEISLEIGLPVKFTDLRVPGNVVWVRKAADSSYEFGVSFADLSEGTKEAITSSPVFMSANVSTKTDRESGNRTSRETAVSYPLPPTIPDKQLAKSILNAYKYKTGPRVDQPTASQFGQKKSKGVLNADRYGWKSFKKNLLNADRYSWKNPGSRILNGGRYHWCDMD